MQGAGQNFFFIRQQVESLSSLVTVENNRKKDATRRQKVMIGLKKGLGE
jgi:hypothetical protein